MNPARLVLATTLVLFALPTATATAAQEAPQEDLRIQLRAMSFDPPVSF